MNKNTQPENPTEWVRMIFVCKTAVRGGVLKRLIKSVEKRASHGHLVDEVKRQGFKMYITATHYIVDCSPDSRMELIC